LLIDQKIFYWELQCLINGDDSISLETSFNLEMKCLAH